MTMIIVFWSIMGLMLLVALSLIVLPLLRVRDKHVMSQKELNIALYRQRIQLLKQQLQAKEVNQAEFDRGKAELNQTLLQDVEPDAKATSLLNRPAKITTLITLVLFCAVAAFAYYKDGDSHGLFHYWALLQEAKVVKAEIKKIKNPQQVINQLIAHLNAYPDSPKGWYLLGRLYFGAGNYAKAYSPLLKAHQLQPNNIEYTVAYAQVEFFHNNRKLSAKTAALLKHVLKKMPYNVGAINLLAINAYVEKDYQTAVNYWERLIPAFQPGSPDSQALLGMIAKAQKHLSHQSAKNTVADVQINVKVHLSAKLKHDAKPTTRVFIFAVPMSGPEMPLAVVSKTVADLPLSIELGQGASMLPGRKLTAGQTVRLIARVAKSGRAIAEPGDLTSTPDILLLHKGKQAATLVIDQTIR